MGDTKKKKNGKTVVFFILALLVLGVIIYVAPPVIGLFASTNQIEKGTLQVRDDVTGYFVRNEAVYVASEGGHLKYHKREGTKIGKNVRIADFVANGLKLEKKDKSEYQDIIDRLSGGGVKTGNCISAESGVVSYMVDGYESVLTPKTMNKISKAEISKMTEDTVSVKRSSAYAGEPVYKIYDNQAWYMIFWVGTGGITKYEQGSTVTIRIGGVDIQASVEKITGDKDQWKVILKSRNYYKDFATLRCENVTIISNDYTGLIINNESITTKKGKPGVYVKKIYGDREFVRVNIIASDGERSVVSADSFTDEDGDLVKTVGAYDEVVKKPEKGT